MTRREFLVGLGASIVIPPLSQLEVVGTTSDAGFFSLQPYARHLIAGTYGTPKSYAWNGSDWWEIPSGELHLAGESLFNMEVCIVDNQLYGVTESSGKIFRLGTEGWEIVFQAPPGWNNGYSIIEWDGYLITGFNVYPENNRSLLCWSRDGENWTTRVVHGNHHPRFAVNHTDLAIVWPNTHGQIEVWDQTLTLRTSVPGKFAGQPLNWKGRLYVAVDGGEETDGAVVWRFDPAPHAVFTVPGQRIAHQFQAHEDELWLASGVAWRASGGQGALWASPDGVTWTRRMTLPEPEGWCMAVYKEDLYVGTRKEGGGGKVYRVVA